MKDLRPIYYHEARERLVGNRLAVYDDLLTAGPMTARELAARMRWEVTSVRPRLTELRDDLAVIETGERRNGEHVFRARTTFEIQAAFAAHQWQLGKSSAAVLSAIASGSSRLTPAELHATQQQELFA